MMLDERLATTVKPTLALLADSVYAGRLQVSWWVDGAWISGRYERPVCMAVLDLMGFAELVPVAQELFNEADDGR